MIEIKTAKIEYELYINVEFWKSFKMVSSLQGRRNLWILEDWYSQYFGRLVESIAIKEAGGGGQSI